jgi:hypothetical protein
MYPSFLLASQFPLLCLFILNLIVSIGKLVQIDITYFGYLISALMLETSALAGHTRLGKLLVILFLLEQIVVVLLMRLVEELSHTES